MNSNPKKMDVLADLQAKAVADAEANNGIGYARKGAGIHDGKIECRARRVSLGKYRFSWTTYGRPTTKTKLREDLARVGGAA